MHSKYIESMQCSFLDNLKKIYEGKTLAKTKVEEKFIKEIKSLAATKERSSHSTQSPGLTT